MFKSLDPLLHNELRLKIMSILLAEKTAEFKFLLEETKATRGNLSAQISKLSKANYIKVQKSFRNNYPLTTCTISKTGIDAFEAYANAIKDYLKS
ncbi:MAG: DNA-binding MarR family transcriptional regulator [Parvicellaceae bacterium]|jgi:DNA-binding MarR family transcriptional regulator